MSAYITSNGSLIRKHMQTVEMGLTLFVLASLSIKFRDQSFTTFVYLTNRLSTTALPKFSSPFYDLYNKKPNYKSIEVIGCTYFPTLETIQST